MINMTITDEKIPTPVAKVFGLRKIMFGREMKRKNGEFYLTSFGQIVRHSRLKIISALKHSSQLRAIDVLRSDPGLPKDRLNSLIDNLIGDPELKRLITLT